MIDDFEEPTELPGMDWGNDELFVTYSYMEETSMFDPKGHWCPGADCYEYKVSVRIPKAFAGNDELRDWFIDKMQDSYPAVTGFYA